MTEEIDGGWVLEPKTDEAGLEYLEVTPPEWGTRYADLGTVEELERLKRENTAQRAIINEQQEHLEEYIRVTDELVAIIRDYQRQHADTLAMIQALADRLAKVQTGEGPK